MKKQVLVPLAVAALVSLGSFGAPTLKTASADQELRYYYREAASTYAVTSETISCTNMIETETVTQYRMPLYYATGELTNCCGPVAGSIVVGFYDRYYEELIPNWTAYYTSNNRYKLCDTTYVPAVMEELYDLMRTNVDDVGVSQSDCKSGLQTYFSNRSRTLSYSTVESNSVFNYSLYKQAIDANKPVLLFCNEVTICMPGYSTSQQAAIITNQSVSGGHIVVGYGYSTVNYYEGDSIFRTDHYLLVSTGLDGFADAYINIASTSWLVDGYAVTVS